MCAARKYMAGAYPGAGGHTVLPVTDFWCDE